MLLECIEHVKQREGDPRTLKLYGQEKNLTTSTIARMNMFLHNIEDFRIERGDTLREPRFFEKDILQTFNIVIANPPFSLKEWGAEIWINDTYGRNIAGVPPQNNGDMAWVQHMLQSMNPRNGRVAVVLPHGALFRKGAEAKIRAILLEKDLLDTVIGLGANIFYGATLSACILIFRAKKEVKKAQKVLFIDAADQIRTGRAQNFLEEEHISRIFQWYADWNDVKDHVKVATLEQIRQNGYNLNISLYVEKEVIDNLPSLEETLHHLKESVKKANEAEQHLKQLLINFTAV
jgi:type I restriction enzyme M protein